jgi:cell division protein FtsL
MAATARAWQDSSFIGGQDESPAARRASARMADRERARLGTQTASTAPVLRDPLFVPDVELRSRTSRAAVQTPRLRVVERKSTWAFPAVVVALALAVAVLVAPTFLNTAAKQADAQQAKLEQRANNLMAERAALSARVAALAATPRIKAQAEKLGMGPAQTVQYVALPSSDTQDAGGAGGAGVSTDAR